MPKQAFEGVLQYLRTVFQNPADRDLTDAELLRRFLTQREETAFTLLVQRHGPMVLSVCRRVLGDFHSAEESFQATFIVLIRRAASIRCTGSLANWLYGVAQRIALKARTQKAARHSRERPLEDIPRAEALDKLSMQELRTVLDEEIARLSEKYRAPIVLCYFEDKSYDQAARELGCSKSSLAKRLTRGRELLRRQLVRRGMALSAGALATALCDKVAGAHISALVTINTVKAAALAAAGKPVAAGCLSAGALALAEEAMAGMFWIKTKMVLVVMAIGMVLGGAGWAGYSRLVERSQPAPPATKAQLPAPKTQESVPAKKAAPVRTDRYGDALPDGAVARLGTERFRLETSPHSTVVSPDGKMIAASALFGRVVVMDATTGKELRAFELPRGISIGAVAFSHESKMLATGSSDNIVRLWDPVSGKALLQIFQHQKAPQNDRLPEIGIMQVAFSPDKKTLGSLGADRTIRLWDIATAGQLYEFDIPPQVDPFGMLSLAFSPDGKTVLFSGGGADERGIIVMWGSASGKEQRRWETASAIVSLAVSPDMMSFATGTSDKKITLWDMATGTELRQLKPEHQGPVVALAFSSDSKMLASGSWLPRPVHISIVGGCLRKRTPQDIDPQ